MIMEGTQAMALTSKEKMQRYRERHLGVAGEKTPLQAVISTHAKSQLDRVARHKGCTITALIEELAAQAENRIVAKLSPAAEKEYYRNDKI
jgi:hypothetical protein